jgi:hypothetical protein
MVAPVITGVVNDTGSSNSDGITSDKTLVINGSADANSTVQIFVDNIFIDQTTADFSGNWSFDDTAQVLSDGNHTIEAISVVGGNSTPGPTFTVRIDTTAPAAPSTPDLIAASDSGSSNTDNVTNVTAVTLTGTAEAGSMVTIFDTNENQILGIVVATGGTYSIKTSELGIGGHTLTARARDAAGNGSAASGGLSLTIDISAPAAPLVTGVTNDTGISSTDGITRDTTLIISGSAEANSSILVFKDGNSIGHHCSERQRCVEL